MKKPVILIRSHFDLLKIALGVALCFGALSLFFNQSSEAVFSQGGADTGVRGLFNMVNGWI